MGSFWILPLFHSMNDSEFADYNFTNYSIVVTSYSVDQLQNHCLLVRSLSIRNIFLLKTGPNMSNSIIGS